MKKLAKNLGKMLVGKRRAKRKGASLAVKISVLALVLKLALRLLTALFFLFPYRVEKREDGLDIKAILYGAAYTKKYDERTGRKCTAFKTYPLGIVGDQLRTAKSLVLRK